MAKKPGRKAKKGPRKKSAPRQVSTAVLADCLGLTEQRISQLVAEGLPKSERGTFPMRDAVRWYIESLRARQQAREDGGPSRQDIQRDLDALKLKRAMGEVFDRREVFDTMAGAYTRLGSDLENLATRIGRELNLPGDDVKMVRGMVDEMRRRFVDDMGEFIEVTEGGQDAAAGEKAA